MIQDELLRLIDEAAADGRESLNLIIDGLTNLPSEISHMTNLRSLCFHCNQLIALPESIDQLVNLQTLLLTRKLSLAAVYTSMAFYFEHPGEIDRRAEEANAFADSDRANQPSLLQEKLNATKNYAWPHSFFLGQKGVIERP